MFPIIAIGLLLVGPVFAQELGDIATFSELSSYLSDHTNGAVSPTQESYLSFKIDHKRMEAIPILRPFMLYE